mmetsp:Transcript_3345/g.5145  ORF Transcript_3345/g.5145 Transcript_3345/m.5145 type:complete len:220 (+) Transcript_3345:130-789(+)
MMMMSFLSAGGEMLNDSFSVNCLLCKESCCCEHSKTPVLKFLGLHDLELSIIIGHKSKRIELKITRCVVVTELTGLVNRTVSRVYPSILCALCLVCSYESNDNCPESIRYLSDVGDSRSGDLCIEQESRSLYLLSYKESNYCKHSNTSVSKLGLTVTSKGSIGCLLSKVEGIEDSHGFKCSNNSVEGCRESRGGLSNLGRSKSSSRCKESGDKNKLHFV